MENEEDKAMLLGIIRCLDAVGDILEYGPVDAFLIFHVF